MSTAARLVESEYVESEERMWETVARTRGKRAGGDGHCCAKGPVLLEHIYSIPMYPVAYMPSIFRSLARIFQRPDL